MGKTPSTSRSFKGSIAVSVLFIALLWCIKSAEILFHIDLTHLGVLPLDPVGLIGILSAPLIHGSLEHLFNNTLALLILGSVFHYGYPVTRVRVLVTVWLLSGILVWLFAREAYHIGASGLTHGIFFYLFVVSIFRKDKRSVGIMMVAFFMYGGMTMSIFPRAPEISYEYHFFGAVAGVLSALLWHRLDSKPKEKVYDWENQQELEDPIIGEQWKGSEPITNTDSTEKQDRTQ